MDFLFGTTETSQWIHWIHWILFLDSLDSLDSLFGFHWILFLNESIILGTFFSFSKRRLLDKKDNSCLGLVSHDWLILPHTKLYFGGHIQQNHTISAVHSGHNMNYCCESGGPWIKPTHDALQQLLTREEVGAS